MQIENNKNLKLIDITRKTDGDFFVVRPSKKSWDTIGIIQDMVTKDFHQRGFHKWRPAPFNLAHVTLFAGIKKATPKERQALAEVIGKVAASVPSFQVNVPLTVSFKDGGVKLNHLGKWVTLYFASDALIELQQKVCQAIKNLVQNETVRVEVIDLDKLTKEQFSPHVTLGILECADPEKDPEVIELKQNQAAWKKLVKTFQKEASQGSLKGVSLSIPVSKIDLLGVEDMTALAKNKQYHTLASCNLLRSMADQVKNKRKHQNSIDLPTHKKPKPTPKAPAYLDELSMAVYSNVDLNYSVTFGKTVDHTGKEMIGIQFQNEHDATQFLQAIDTRPGSKVHKDPTSHLYGVKLGEARCQRLFGETKGKKVYQDAIASLPPL